MKKFKIGILAISVFSLLCGVLYVVSWINDAVTGERNGWLVMQLSFFFMDEARLPSDVSELARYIVATSHAEESPEKRLPIVERKLRLYYDFSRASISDVVKGHKDFVILRKKDDHRQRIINDRLAALLRINWNDDEPMKKVLEKNGSFAADGGAKKVIHVVPQPVVEADDYPVAESAIAERFGRQPEAAAEAEQWASDMNDVMDEMLNRSEIPADYAETMVALFRDESRGDVIRDFAVQHIGLYAETLNMRGKYDADSTESATLRDALWDAAEETHTIVAAAAFRALADMAVFDPRIDASRLDNRLASCVADSSASPAARVMAAQICGERRVVSARAALAAIAADSAQLAPLRLAAANSARLLAE